MNVQVLTDWIFSIPVSGDAFRIEQSLTLPTSAQNYPRLLICQAEFNDSQVSIYDKQLIYYSKELEVIQLKKPSVFSDRRIGIKKVDNYRSASQLIAKVEVSDVPIQISQLAEREVTELKTIAANNTVLDLAFVPIANSVRLIVNGISYFSIVPTPAFSHVAKVITWIAANSFTLTPTDEVVAIYRTEE